MVKIICISGKAQHGKDTTATFLKSILEGYNRKVLIIHNADLLKYMCKQLFGWNGTKDEKGRRLLQYVGTDVVREKEPSFWVDYIIRIAKLFGDNWDYILVPDCRFPNEIVRFIESGFDTFHIRVSRGDFDNGLTNEQKKHPSETALDNTTPDYTLYNCSDLNHLSQSIASMISLNHQVFDIDNVRNDESKCMFESVDTGAEVVVSFKNGSSISALNTAQNIKLNDIAFDMQSIKKSFVNIDKSAAG